MASDKRSKNQLTMSTVPKQKNPIKVMLVIIIVLILGVIAIQLFVKKKVQLDDGTTGRSGVFGNLEPKEEISNDQQPAPAV